MPGFGRWGRPAEKSRLVFPAPKRIDMKGEPTPRQPSPTRIGGHVARAARPPELQERRALLLTDAQPLGSGKAVDAALDLEQCVNTPDRLQRDSARSLLHSCPALHWRRCSASSKNCLLAWAQ